MVTVENKNSHRKSKLALNPWTSNGLTKQILASHSSGVWQQMKPNCEGDSAGASFTFIIHTVQGEFKIKFMAFLHPHVLL